MEEKKSNNNNNVMKAAVYRGWSKAKIEGIETTIVGHGKCLRQIQSDITKIKEFMAADNAVKKFKNGLWGFIGGFISVVCFFISKFIFKF